MQGLRGLGSGIKAESQVSWRKGLSGVIITVMVMAPQACGEGRYVMYEVLLEVLRLKRGPRVSSQGGGVRGGSMAGGRSAWEDEEELRDVFWGLGGPRVI